MVVETRARKRWQRNDADNVLQGEAAGASLEKDASLLDDYNGSRSMKKKKPHIEKGVCYRCGGQSRTSLGHADLCHRRKCDTLFFSGCARCIQSIKMCQINPRLHYASECHPVGCKRQRPLSAALSHPSKTNPFTFHRHSAFATCCWHEL
jgi:hypothetical protein